jgi:hypothetical protein
MKNRGSFQEEQTMDDMAEQAAEETGEITNAKEETETTKESEAPSVDSQIAYLEACKKALKELQAAKDKRDSLDIREKKQAKALAAEKKTVEDQVNSTIKKRKEELQNSYDTEIGKVQDSIKKAKSKREKAKQKGIKARIEEQTAPFEAENKGLKTQIREQFKQNHIPMICNTTLYYALYFPKTLKEMLILMITFVVCFVGIPVGAYWLIPHHRTLHLIIIYLVTIVVFGGLYLLIGGLTKDRHKEIIVEVQKTRRTIAKNKRKMNSLNRSIRREKTEEHYDLSSFDGEISALEQEKADLTEKKEEAMAYFVSTTKPTITEEIVSAKRDRINEMEAEHNQTAKELSETETYIKESTLKVSKEYESYIGKDYMQTDKLDGMIQILKKGQAANITAAKIAYQEQGEKDRK